MIRNSTILSLILVVGLSNMVLSLIMHRFKYNRVMTLSRTRLWSTAVYETAQDDVFGKIRSASSKISPYWLQQLDKVENPNARGLIPLLLETNAIGYELSSATNGTIKKTKGLFDFTLDEKERFPDCVILMRCGEFYETYGVDAVMMVEHAGLNPMGGKARAGCPVNGVQNVLNRLTDAGLTVAVYEEVVDVEKNKNKQKKRVLQQIVSQAHRNYLHDISLSRDTNDFKTNRPIVGVLQSIGFDGYSLYEYHADQKKVTVTERLTPEAVLSIIESTGCVEPIFVQSAKDKRFLTEYYQVEELRGYDDKDFFSQIKARCSRKYEMDVSHVQEHRREYQSQARPVYTSTALQIGLKNNKNVPDLIKALLPRNYDEYTSRFLREWLLIPPPHHIADHMQSLNRLLMTLDSATPKFTPTSLGKVVSLLTSGEANPQLFRDVHRNIYSLLSMLTDPALQSLLDPLLAITSHESGIPAKMDNLMSGCERVLNSIESVVAHSMTSDGHNTDPFGKISEDLFKRNEEEFRGQVAPLNPEVQRVYADIAAAAGELSRAVNEDYPPLSECEVKYEALNNAIFYIQRKPTSRTRGKKSGNATAATASALVEEDNTDDVTEEEGSREDTVETIESVSVDMEVSTAVSKDFKKDRIHFIDRKGKSHATKFTTQRVNDALKEYLAKTEAAPAFIKGLLRGLCEKLIADTDLVTIQHATHWAVILTAARLHTASARQKQWCLPTLVNIGQSTTSGGKPATVAAPPCLSVKGLSPYWIDRERAVLNDVALRGLFLLTAPNMSGKSTLMRSLLVTALLANCGLYVPASSAAVPRYDNFFLRTSSYDVPQEGKSAFALEMDDLRVVLRDCTNKSLVMIDEFGKGTSSKDGSGLSGALLETLDQKQVSGIFSTHLHELFHLPLKLSRRVQNKRMGLMRDDEESDLQWTYQLEDGKCTDSMALVTAKEYSISPTIIGRAEELIGVFDKQCRSSSATDSDTSSAFTIVGDDELPWESVEVPEPEPTFVPTSIPLAAASPTVDYDGDDGEWERIKYDLNRDVLPVLSEIMSKIKKVATLSTNVVDSEASTSSSPVVIGASQDPPVSLEGHSCVYVLHLHKPNVKSSHDRFYVGETESMMQRLKRHREGYQKEGYAVHAVAVRVNNKSEARNVETLLIKRLKSKGFDIEGGSDERHSLFGKRFV